MIFARPHILIIVGDEGLVVVPYCIPDVLPFFVSKEDGAGLQEVKNVVGEHPSARLTLLADNLAQDYRSDDLPPITLLDRAKLVARRLKTTFPSARLTAALPFRKSPRRVLLVGVHESNPVFGWVETFRERLPEITLLPVEGSKLGARLMPQATKAWAMVLSRQKSGGFRQIVTYKNDLVFTRLTPLSPEESPASEAEVVARDIKASLDYLIRHGLRNVQDLHLLLLGFGAKDCSSVQETLKLGSVRFMSPAQAARLLRLPFAPEDNDCYSDLLYAGLVVSRLRPVLPLMLPDMKNIRLTGAIQTWAGRLSWAFLFLAFIGTLWRGIDFGATFYLARKEGAELASFQAAFDKERKEASPVTEPLKILRQALERRRIYEQPFATPWQALNGLLGAIWIEGGNRLVYVEWNKKDSASAETLRVGVAVSASTDTEDKAAVVEAFGRVVRDVFQALPDFIVVSVRPPYPSLPKDTVSTVSRSSEGSVGEILLERKRP